MFMYSSNASDCPILYTLFGYNIYMVQYNTGISVLVPPFLYIFYILYFFQSLGTPELD